MQEGGHVQVQVVHLALDRNIGLGEGLPKPGVEAFHAHLKPHLPFDENSNTCKAKNGS